MLTNMAAEDLVVVVVVEVKVLPRPNQPWLSPFLLCMKRFHDSNGMACTLNQEWWGRTQTMLLAW